MIFTEDSMKPTSLTNGGHEQVYEQDKDVFPDILADKYHEDVLLIHNSEFITLMVKLYTFISEVEEDSTMDQETLMGRFNILNSQDMIKEKKMEALCIFVNMARMTIHGMTNVTAISVEKWLEAIAKINVCTQLMRDAKESIQENNEKKYNQNIIAVAKIIYIVCKQLGYQDETNNSSHRGELKDTLGGELPA